MNCLHCLSVIHARNRCIIMLHPMNSPGFTDVTFRSCSAEITNYMESQMRRTWVAGREVKVIGLRKVKVWGRSRVSPL